MVIRASCCYLLLILLSPPVLFADQSPLQKVDCLRQQGAFDQAFVLLQTLQQEKPHNAEVLWRLAYVRVELGEAARLKQQRNQRYRQALTDAQAAVKADAENANAYAARAIAAGRVSLISSSKREKLQLSRTVKESADRAIKLDPRHDVAYYIRARWNIEVANLGFLERTVARTFYGNLPEASLKKALQDIKRAVKLKNRIIYRLELSRIYLKLNRPDRAVQHLQELLQMPATGPDDSKYKAEARKLLAKRQTTP